MMCSICRKSMWATSWRLSRITRRSTVGGLTRRRARSCSGATTSRSRASPIPGRGALRRFKDTLLDFPDLREAWFRFHDARVERRAIWWLVEEGLVDRAAAERAVAERAGPELPELSGPFDPHQIAREVAGDLRRLYGDRLSSVVLFGSWARGDAHPESDID